MQHSKFDQMVLKGDFYTTFAWMVLASLLDLVQTQERLNASASDGILVWITWEFMIIFDKTWNLLMLSKTLLFNPNHIDFWHFFVGYHSRLPI